MVFLRGYLFAAAGPLLVGVARDLTGGFTAAFGLLLVLMSVQVGSAALLHQGHE